MVIVFCGRYNIGLVSLILLDWELRVSYQCTMCTRHPDIVSLDVYAIHIFRLDIYLSPLTTIPNLLGASIQQCHEQPKNTTCMS